MADTRTANGRRFSAPHITRARRFAVAALATLGGLATIAVPAASGQRHHRHQAVPGCVGAHARISSTARSELQAAVVCLVNAQRTSRGLPALRESGRLDRSAQAWTNMMVRVHNLTHGTDFASRISAVGFIWSQAGENIADGFETPTAVVRAWMASPGHCRNILSPSFLDVGTGVSVAGAAGHGTWTQDFGLPTGSHPPSGNVGPARGCPYR